jgi:hypothetical protein
MTTYVWPDWMRYQSATLVVRHDQVVSSSVFGRGDQVVTHPGSRWGLDVEFGSQPLDMRARVEAFLTRLTGMQHRVRMSDPQLYTPNGTCRMQGVTIRAAVAQFATVLPIAGCGVTATLLEGDWLEAFGQLFRVVANTTATASGTMDVEVRHMVRVAIPAGTPVVLDRPTALFGLDDMSLSLPRTGGDEQPSFSVRFIERFI